jgi:hypothetical protein
MSQKNLSQKRVGGVAQGVDPEFKPQYQGGKTKTKKQDWQNGSSSRVPV